MTSPRCQGVGGQEAGPKGSTPARRRSSCRAAASLIGVVSGSVTSRIFVFSVSCATIPQSGTGGPGQKNPRPVRRSIVVWRWGEHQCWDVGLLPPPQTNQTATVNGLPLQNRPSGLLRNSPSSCHFRFVCSQLSGRCYYSDARGRVWVEFYFILNS